MKHISIVQGEASDGLKERIEKWIEENKDEILEIIDIEYSQYGNIYSATVTYEEK